MGTEIPNGRVGVAELVLDALEVMGFEAFVDASGCATISLPDDDPDIGNRKYPLRSQRFRDVLCAYVWKHHGVSLKPRELDQILGVLAGTCWEDNRSNSDVTAALDTDPLFEAICIFMNLPGQRGYFEGTCSALLKELEKIAATESLDRNSRKWPKASQRLSRRIKELQRLLDSAGIQVDLGRRVASKRTCTLRLIRDDDDPSVTASSAPSSSNSSTRQPLQRCDADDDGDGIFRDIDSKKGPP